MPHFGVSAYLLAGILAVLGLATSRFERSAYRAGTGGSSTLVVYTVSILCSWSLTAVAVSIYGWAPLLIAPGWAVPAIATLVLAAAVAVFFVVALLPLLQGLRGPRKRRAYEAAIRREFAEIPGFIPNSAAERAVWIPFSLTAGICEEILYRGFLIHFLHDGAFALPIVGALAASSVLFGLGHVYQGPKSVLTITIGGFGFGLLFLLSGSLIPCIVLHAIMDLQMLYVVRPLPGEAAAAAPEPA
jgi:membrane protease YdiL (CAAX protease family)